MKKTLKFAGGNYDVELLSRRKNIQHVQIFRGYRSVRGQYDLLSHRWIKRCDLREFGQTDSQDFDKEVENTVLELVKEKNTNDRQKKG